MSVVGLRLFVGADVPWPGWGGAWAATWSCRHRRGFGQGVGKLRRHRLLGLGRGGATRATAA